MKTMFPRDRRRVAGRLSGRKHSAPPAGKGAMIDAVPIDVRIALVAAAAVLLAAACEYSPALAVFLYALIGATFVVSAMGRREV
jgi:hypothetical protein